MEEKRIIACIDAQNETEETVLKLAEEYETNGADGLYVYNHSKNEQEREKFIGMLRKLSEMSDLPFLSGCYVDRLEDVKKVYYAGSAGVVIDMAYVSDAGMLARAVEKFGKDKIYACVNCGFDYKEDRLAELKTAFQECLDAGAYGIVAKHVTLTPELVSCIAGQTCPVIIRDSLQRNSIPNLLELSGVTAVATNFYAGRDIRKVKQSLAGQGIPVYMPKSPMSFAELKKNSDGLVPVIVQDDKTNEVLMLAYMDEEAYNTTISTGKMTYYSRSRRKLWVKGETSGHFQYVRSLSVDCDDDTLLARVKQIGAACHTGNRSCFYRTLLQTEFDLVPAGSGDNDISHVLDKVFATVSDRKAHPKEGSYTNYLFDHGIDKILKKCGEEATEIVIAAKNPDAEELRYEIADFLYHVMVLMVECGLTWEDISRELANRE